MTIKLNVKTIETINYSEDSKWKLAGLEFSAIGGQLVMIKGESGIGKTTILDFILGQKIFTANKGKVEIIYQGNSYTAAAGRQQQLMGYVFIKSPFFNWCSVRESIESIGYLARENKFNRVYLNKSELAKWGLEAELLDSKPHELSSGQKRRFALVAGMAMSPKILIIDEVFRGLDGDSRKLVRERLTDYRRENKAIIIVSTHAAEEFDDLETDECQQFELIMGADNTAKFRSY